jgi:hypothetical protein
MYLENQGNSYSLRDKKIFVRNAPAPRIFKVKGQNNKK